MLEKARTLTAPAWRAVTFARSPFFSEVWDGLRTRTFGFAAAAWAPWSPAPSAIAVEKTDAASTASAKANLLTPLKPFSSNRGCRRLPDLLPAAPRPYQPGVYNNLYRVSQLRAGNSATLPRRSIEN